MTTKMKFEKLLEPGYIGKNEVRKATGTWLHRETAD